MKAKLFLISCLFLISQLSHAQNWDYVRSSGEYYYGIGMGKTEVEADQAALAEITSQIATHVSSDFVQIDDMVNKNGQLDHKSKVLNCVKTYSQSTLTNTEKWVLGKEPNITVRRYMKRSELARIYENRIAKAKDMMALAEECLGKNMIDMSLQYYYWAYSLVRSVQFPNEVKDAQGRILVDWLPVMINEILGAIKVRVEKTEGDHVDLLFTYQNQPISSLEFSYSDGRTDCLGSVRDGRGSIEMAPGYQTQVYHINLEYEYKGQARGDAEMESVLGVITPKVFSRAEMRIEAASPKNVESLAIANQGNTQVAMKTESALDSAHPASLAKPKKSQLAANYQEIEGILGQIIEAIQKRNFMSVSKYFTVEGLNIYRKLNAYGTGRIVGNPTITYYKGIKNRTVARGLQMSFCFKSGKKRSYVEDVVFTFNPENKIENVSFGLGKVAENDILCKYAPGWKDDTREIIMEFMENYKTAYNLRRLDYIRNIFADDAVIIVGNVARRSNRAIGANERNISLRGQEVIHYNRYTKDQYLANLERCFHNNEFVNLRFSHNDVQWLEKYENEEIYAIQIGQEYNSSTYADKGYLFLLVDMTNHDEPQIKIRTWQPNEVAMEKLYNAGDFYKD